MKKCPFCAEEIQDAAIKCRHCGSMLDQPAPLAASVSERQRPLSKPAAAVPGGLFILVLIIFLVVVGVGYLIRSVPGPASFATAPLSPQGSTAVVNAQPVRPAAATVAPTVPSQNTAAAESARAAVAKMVNLGLIKRMDVKTGKFYIDGPLWVGFQLDGKENIVKVISGYRQAEYKGLPQVTLYESRSGRELANYGAFSGVTIK